MGTFMTIILSIVIAFLASFITVMVFSITNEIKVYHKPWLILGLIFGVAAFACISWCDYTVDRAAHYMRQNRELVTTIHNLNDRARELEFERSQDNFCFFESSSVTKTIDTTMLAVNGADTTSVHIHIIKK